MFRRLLVVVFCSSLAASCFDPPEYPDAPDISFQSVSYVKGGLLGDGQGQAADSVVVVLKFKDGDGDVGISSEETSPPFNDRWYYTKKPLEQDNRYRDDCTTYTNMCWFYSDVVTEFDKFVKYSDRGIAPFDSLLTKTFSKPYNCLNWEVVYYDDDNNPDTQTVPLDTLYFELNPHYNNIFVDFQFRNGQPLDPGNPEVGYDTFDERAFFTYPFCGVRTFYGRIPILSESSGEGTPLEGTIRYAMPSVSFQTIFGAKQLRLRVSIEDRALNRSNTVYTREFNLLENN